MRGCMGSLAGQKTAEAVENGESDKSLNHDPRGVRDAERRASPNPQTTVELNLLLFVY